jgi:large subunit ribosomal protein L32
MADDAPGQVFENRESGIEIEEAMAVPKRRVSHARQGKRRSHQHLTPIQVQYCPNCGEPVLPHRVCANCGQYRNREIEKAEAEEK